MWLDAAGAESEPSARCNMASSQRVRRRRPKKEQMDRSKEVDGGDARHVRAKMQRECPLAAPYYTKNTL